MAQPSYSDRIELANAWNGAPLAGLNQANSDVFDTSLSAYLRERQLPRFFFDHKAAGDLGEQIAASHPEEAKWVVDRANHALAHRFPASDGDFEGYDVQLPADIQWYENPSREPTFIFTLNRHRFWPELAMAYRFTGDAEYIAELQRQVISWNEQSPRLNNPDDWKTNPHYWNLLDAAIRADTWIWALFLVLDAPEWQPAVNTILVHRLLVTARFLRHLTPRVGKYDDWASNWLIMQAQGLLNIALMFPEFAEAPEWEAHATEVLRLCLTSQFASDGGHCEQSPSYHEGCLRWLAEPLYLARLNGRRELDGAWATIEIACEFHYQLTMPDGSLPVLSDSDRHSDGTLTLMGIFFKRSEWMRYQSPTARDRWLFREAADQVSGVLQDRPRAIAFPASGYYVMRSGDQPDSLQMVFDCGPHGGDHGHFDLLSFDLFGYGRPLIVDPGRLIYDDSSERRWALGTPSHNTVSLDNRNHAAVGAHQVDRLHVVRWEVEATHTLVSAWHEGYRELIGSPLVGRTIWFDGMSTFVVVDWAVSSAEHEAVVSFTLPGSDLPRLLGGGLRTAYAKGNVVVKPLLRPGQFISAAPTFHSPNYGHREPAMRLTVTECARECLFVTVVKAFDQVPASWDFDVAPVIERGNVRLRMKSGAGATDLGFAPPFAFP